MLLDSITYALAAATVAVVGTWLLVNTQVFSNNKNTKNKQKVTHIFKITKINNSLEIHLRDYTYKNIKMLYYRRKKTFSRAKI